MYDRKGTLKFAAYIYDRNLRLAKFDGIGAMLQS